MKLIQATAKQFTSSWFDRLELIPWIYVLMYFVWPMSSLEWDEFQRCIYLCVVLYSNDQRSPIFIRWLSSALEKFVSQVVTWQAVTRVFLPTTNGGRGEITWERGLRRVCCWDYLQSFSRSFFNVFSSYFLFYSGTVMLWNIDQQAAISHHASKWKPYLAHILLKEWLWKPYVICHSPLGLFRTNETNNDK